MDTEEPLEPPDPQESFMGYSHAVLEAHFNMIRPKLHWKAPIEAEVPRHADLRCIEAAIIYFTGCSGEFHKHGNTIEVVAPGYWASQY